MPENFIREFKDKVDWNCISQFQNLSENFIKEFKDKVNWVNISHCQNLSEDFIREFKDKIYWRGLQLNYKVKVSDAFTIEFDNKLYYIDNCGIACWIINGCFHRILGAARIVVDEYWYRGKRINVNSYEEYLEWLKYYKYF